MDRAPDHADLLVTNLSQIATPRGSSLLKGEALSSEVLVGAAVAVRDGLIADVGPEGELRKRWRAAEVLDGRGGILVPGFVDAHTHPVFAGTREAEFELRVAGASYVEIARAGGGILSSLKGVREASKEQLLALLLDRLHRFVELCTTTVEAKTGYGLTPEDELKCLEVLALAQEEHGIEIVPTFLGAHDYPPEYRDRREAYVDLLVEEMLPAVAESGLAEPVDRGAGLDQLTPLGGAELAAELGAASADHLERVTPRGIEALARANVVPVLCPLVPLFLRDDGEAPAREMIRAGLAPALATDFNPGSCYTQSMPEVLTWAALRYGMSASEALAAATLNAACSLGRGERIGSIEVGKEADLLVLDLPNLQHLTYEFGRNPVRVVIKRGVVLYERLDEPL